MPHEHVPDDDTEGGHGAYDPYETPAPELQADGEHSAPRPLFPWTRLFYAVGFFVLAWLTFWFLAILAVVQFVFTAINGKPNDELKHFAASAAQYLWELVAYVNWAREERPFPFAPFPKV